MIPVKDQLFCFKKVEAEHKKMWVYTLIAILILSGNETKNYLTGRFWGVDPARNNQRIYLRAKAITILGDSDWFKYLESL